MKFQATRELVVKTCVELADRGYLAATGGNVALRADEKYFAVTPSATALLARLRAEALFGGPEDSLSLRIPGREEIRGVQPQATRPDEYRKAWTVTSRT